MVFFSSVASVLQSSVVVGKDFLVVVVDDAAHVHHAAVADFHIVLVKDGVIRLRKVLATLVWTFLLYGGVKPDDALFSISFRGCGCVFLVVVKVYAESA